MPVDSQQNYLFFRMSPFKKVHGFHQHILGFYNLILLETRKQEPWAEYKVT